MGWGKQTRVQSDRVQSVPMHSQPLRRIPGRVIFVFLYCLTGIRRRYRNRLGRGGREKEEGKSQGELCCWGLTASPGRLTKKFVPDFP